MAVPTTTGPGGTPPDRTILAVEFEAKKLKEIQDSLKSATASLQNYGLNWKSLLKTGEAWYSARKKGDEETLKSLNNMGVALKKAGIQKMEEWGKASVRAMIDQQKAFESFRRMTMMSGQEVQKSLMSVSLAAGAAGESLEDATAAAVALRKAGINKTGEDLGKLVESSGKMARVLNVDAASAATYYAKKMQLLDMTDKQVDASMRGMIHTIQALGVTGEEALEVFDKFGPNMLAVMRANRGETAKFEEGVLSLEGEFKKLGISAEFTLNAINKALAPAPDQLKDLALIAGLTGASIQQVMDEAAKAPEKFSLRTAKMADQVARMSHGNIIAAQAMAQAWGVPLDMVQKAISAQAQHKSLYKDMEKEIKEANRLKAITKDEDKAFADSMATWDEGTTQFKRALGLLWTTSLQPILGKFANFLGWLLGKIGTFTISFVEAHKTFQAFFGELASAATVSSIIMGALGTVKRIFGLVSSIAKFVKTGEVGAILGGGETSGGIAFLGKIAKFLRGVKSLFTGGEIWTSIGGFLKSLTKLSSLRSLVGGGESAGFMSGVGKLFSGGFGHMLASFFGLFEIAAGVKMVFTPGWRNKVLGVVRIIGGILDMTAVGKIPGMIIGLIVQWADKITDALINARQTVEDFVDKHPWLKALLPGKALFDAGMTIYHHFASGPAARPGKRMLELQAGAAPKGTGAEPPRKAGGGVIVGEAGKEAITPIGELLRTARNSAAITGEVIAGKATKVGLQQLDVQTQMAEDIHKLVENSSSTTGGASKLVSWVGHAARSAASAVGSAVSAAAGAVGNAVSSGNKALETMARIPGGGAPQDFSFSVGETGKLDLKSFKDKIAQVESGGVYDKRNKDTDALGRYQFVHKTLADLTGWQREKTPKGQLRLPESVASQFLTTPKLQEDVMDKFTMENLNQLKSSENGRVTEQLLAAAHFLGPKGALDWMHAGANPNFNPTEGTAIHNASVGRYIKGFSNAVIAERGGFADRPTPAVFGDAGPELIMPVRSMINAMVRAVAISKSPEAITSANAAGNSLPAIASKQLAVQEQIRDILKNRLQGPGASGNSASSTPSGQSLAKASAMSTGFAVNSPFSSR